MFRKLKTLSLLKKIGIGGAAIAVLGVAGIASHPNNANLNAQNADTTGVLGSQTTDDTAQQKVPAVTTETTTETQPIPFSNTTVSTDSLPKGTTKITTPGVDGVSTLTYKITSTDGKQTKKELLSQAVTTPSVTQITSVGTYVAPAPAVSVPTTNSSCDPNYSGACVPNVYPTDVDCIGGGGNGPYYVQGPVQVIGTDHYGLDRDHNGVGCE